MYIHILFNESSMKWAKLVIGFVAIKINKRKKIFTFNHFNQCFLESIQIFSVWLQILRHKYITICSLCI